MASNKSQAPKPGPTRLTSQTSHMLLKKAYSDEQIAFLQEFLKRSNAISRGEIVRL